MAKETIHIYSTEQHNEVDKGIDNMATRFHVTNKDVLYAMWTIAKDSIWSKLTLDTIDRNREIKKEKAAMLKKEATDE